MEKEPRLGAACIVVHENKVLLGKRNKKNAKGLWVIPGGGINFGEKMIDAAKREVKEETNIDVEIQKFVDFQEIINIPGEYHSIVFFFLAKPTSFDLVAREDLSEAKFFSLEEIKKLNKVESIDIALKKAGLI